MDKPLELFVSNDSEQETTLMPIDVFMPYPIHALIINYQPASLQKLEHHLSHCSNCSWDSISSLTGHPGPNARSAGYNLLLLILPNDEHQAARALEYAASYNIDIILLGHDTPQTVLRLAFQQGVSDFIALGAPNTELMEAIRNISEQLEKKAELAPVAVVLNGKSGSGASFIATSLAGIIAEREKSEVALIDSDLHYGTLAHMLGAKPNYFITDALQSLEQLDAVALKSAMTNKKKLHLLAAQPFWMLNCDERLNPDQMKKLLWKCRQHYSQVIIDQSRGPEHWNAQVLEDAEILLVLQQNVMSIRQSTALIRQLTTQMGIEPGKIHILINRYEKSGTDITQADIKKTTGIDSVWIVANDFKLASQCTDLGVPLMDIAKRTRILTDLEKIAERFFPQSQGPAKVSSSIWSRIFGS